MELKETKVILVKLGLKVHKESLVQVSYAMSDAATFDREVGALKLARDKTGIRDCTIVTWDDEDESDGIRIVPAWKWLLA